MIGWAAMPSLLTPILLVALNSISLVRDHSPTLQELSRGAVAACVATVQQQESRWDGAGQLILTDTALVIQRCITGSVGPRVTLTEVGGTVGATTLNHPARPHYQVGQTYLVFMTPRASGGLRTFHGPFGRLQVIRKPGGREEVVLAGDRTPVDMEELEARISLALEVGP